MYAIPGRRPERRPFEFPLLEDPEYRTAIVVLETAGSIHAVAENTLDVPHTAYLHGGLFRSSRRIPLAIEVVVRRIGGVVEAEYIGEPRPGGIVGRLLAPEGKTVTHVDRFILPSITQVEYRIGDSTHVCVTVAMTPLEDYRTRLFAVVNIRLPIPGWLVEPILKPLFLRIFRQDAFMLAKQAESIARFEGERFVSTEADVLGPHIHRMLKMAEGGDRGSAVETEIRRGKLFL
jgi:hypothetical protein